MNKILESIKTTNIMNKFCLATRMMDDSATTIININGRKKTIASPGCEEELREIEGLINAAYK